MMIKSSQTSETIYSRLEVRASRLRRPRSSHGDFVVCVCSPFGPPAVRKNFGPATSASTPLSIAACVSKTGAKVHARRSVRGRLYFPFVLDERGGTIRRFRARERTSNDEIVDDVRSFSARCSREEPKNGQTEKGGFFASRKLLRGSSGARRSDAVSSGCLHWTKRATV